MVRIVLKLNVPEVDPFSFRAWEGEALLNDEIPWEPYNIWIFDRIDRIFMMWKWNFAWNKTLCMLRFWKEIWIFQLCYFYFSSPYHTPTKQLKLLWIISILERIDKNRKISSKASELRSILDLTHQLRFHLCYLQRRNKFKLHTADRSIPVLILTP